MKLQLRVPVVVGEAMEVSPKALESIKGQWATILIGGRAILSQVTDSAMVDTTLWLELEAADLPGISVRELDVSLIPDPDPEEVVLDWSQVQQERPATHINCPHDPAGMNLENAMVCDGPR